MLNWRTTLGGILAAIGQYLETIVDPAWVSAIGKVLSIAGVFIIGLTARDTNVSTEAQRASGTSMK